MDSLLNTSFLDSFVNSLQLKVAQNEFDEATSSRRKDELADVSANSLKEDLALNQFYISFLYRTSSF
jgi:hypothetical protein